MRISGRAAGERSSHAELSPFDVASLNHIAHAAFPAGQAGASGLDFQEHDPPYPTLGKAVKDHEIYGAAEKASIVVYRTFQIRK